MPVKTAIYPGSFDPITLGHIDVVKRLCGMYENVIVLVANSASKSRLFTTEERVTLSREALKDLKNVTVETYNGLTVEFAKKSGDAVMVRSLRGMSDFDFERGIAEANRLLAPSIDTLFLMARPEYTGIASSLVKEIAKNGGELSQFVTANVQKALKSKF